MKKDQKPSELETKVIKFIEKYILPPVAVIGPLAFFFSARNEQIAGSPDYSIPNIFENKVSSYDQTQEKEIAKYSTINNDTFKTELNYKKYKFDTK